MRLLAVIDDALAVVERVLVVIAFALLVAIVFGNILTRNLLQVSVTAVLEAAPAMMLWLSLIGATLALKSNRHIKLELFLRFCPIPVQRAARRAAAGFGLVVTGILVVAAVGFVRNEMDLFGPWGIATVVFPMFFAIAVFRFLRQLIDPDVYRPPHPGASAPPESRP